MALVEVEASRSEQQHALSIGAVRAFECLLSELTLGAGGWTGSGITIVAVGDTLGIGTWVGKIEPRCHTVNVIPHSPSLDKARIVAYYSSPRVWGG